MTRFAFAFDSRYRAAALPFGITPGTAEVVVEDGQLRARFGLWRVATDLSNITETTITGPYSALRTMGPAHISLKDHGLTFATNGDRGLCILFAQPVTGIDPLGVIKHPGLTVTVSDPEALGTAIENEAR